MLLRSRYRLAASTLAAACLAATQTSPALPVFTHSFAKNPDAWSPCSSSPPSLASPYSISPSTLILTTGDSSGTANPGFQESAAVTAADSDFAFIAQTRHFRARGLKFDGLGTDFPLHKALFRFTLTSASDSPAPPANSVTLEINGDSSGVRLITTGHEETQASTILELNLAPTPVSGFDLTLEPASPSLTAFHLQLHTPAGPAIHRGSFAIAADSWNQPPAAAIRLSASENDVTTPNARFAASLSGFDVLKPGADPNARRNVLWIICDDFRPQIAGYRQDLHGLPRMITPHIDQLAASGTLFERAFCNIPLCGPSRLSVLSGLRPFKSPGQAHGRFWSNDSFLRQTSPVSPHGINYGGDTLPQHFKNHGYATRAVGKVYHAQNTDWRAATYPLDPSQGYGTYQEPAWDHSQRIPANWNKPTPAFEIGDGSHSLERSGTIRRSDSDHYNPDADRVDAVLAQLHELSSRSFFIACGLTSPHIPFNQPKRYWDLYPRDSISRPHNHFVPTLAPPISIHNSSELRSYSNIPNSGPIPDELAIDLIRGYYAAVSFMDAQIGRLIDGLKHSYDDEGNRLWDNTIIALVGDHGWHLQEQSMWAKVTNYRVAVQAPMIIRSPDIAPGSRVRAPVEFVDLYPTLCDLAGTGFPATNHLEGSSLVPLMANPEQPWKPAAFARFQFADSVFTERYAYTEFIDQHDAPVAVMLYDLAHDPHETHNIAPDNPQLVAALHQLLGGGTPEGKRHAWKALVDPTDPNRPLTTPLSLPEPVHPPNYPAPHPNPTATEISHSVARGTDPLTFTLSLSAWNGNPFDSFTIHYTTDDSDPSPSSSPAFTEPLTLATAQAHTLKVLAIDSRGSASASATIHLLVDPQDGLRQPELQWLHPLPGAPPLTPGGSTRLAVRASNAEGLIHRVAFFAGDEPLGTADRPPFTVPWQHLPIGRFPLAAMALDSQGRILASASSVASVAGDSPNLLVNPGFESGTTAGWRNFGAQSYRVETSRRSGGYAWLSENRIPAWSGPAQDLDQALRHGRSYRISVWGRTTNTPSADLLLRVKQVDDDIDQGLVLDQKTVTNQDWTQLTGTFHLNVSPPLSKLFLFVSSPDAATSFLIDDAECREITTTSRGVSVDWLIANGITGDPETEQELDHDHDGIPTWLEFAAGTDPRDGASAFRIIAAHRTPDGRHSLDWTGSRQSGGLLGWNVWRTSDLTRPASWRLVASGLPRDPFRSGLNSWTDPEPVPPKALPVFYRIELPW